MGTKLYQIELDQSIVDCGMSYVIKLDNGSFIIIDGGYFNPGEEDRLYHFLCERCNGTPLIKAWFFSHAHQDHIGNFIQFIKKYKTAVKIEKLIYNFQPVDFSGITDDWKSSDPATVKEFYRVVNKYCKDIEKVILHTGDKIIFDELTIDVLYTHEDLFLDGATFNDHSTVIMTTIESQNILWLGDIGANGSEILLNNTSDLNCDIVQIAHHGFNGATCELYAKTEAKVALWPTPDYEMEKQKNRIVNQFILQEMNIREHFVSGYGTVELSLPYELNTATKYEKTFSSVSI